MYRKLKLFLIRHAVIWNLSRLNNRILEIKKILEEEENLDLKEKLTNLHSKFVDYIQQLHQCNEL